MKPTMRKLIAKSLGVCLGMMGFAGGFAIANGNGPSYPFIDVPDDISISAHQAIEYAYGERLICGTIDNRFEPDKEVTRLQLALILERLSRDRNERAACLNEPDNPPIANEPISPPATEVTSPSTTAPAITTTTARIPSTTTSPTTTTAVPTTTTTVAPTSPTTTISDIWRPVIQLIKGDNGAVVGWRLKNYPSIDIDLYIDTQSRVCIQTAIGDSTGETCLWRPWDSEWEISPGIYGTRYRIGKDSTSNVERSFTPQAGGGGGASTRLIDINFRCRPECTVETINQ